MAKIDAVRRECGDIGTSLGRDDTDARTAIAEIQSKAMASADDASAEKLVKELDAFRSKFKIPKDVAATYR